MQPNPADEHLTYSQSNTELENIERLMQIDNCDIYTLADYTRRATELLHMCRQRLTATEEQLRATLASLQQQ